MIEPNEVLPLVLHSVALAALLVALVFNMRAGYYLRKSRDALRRSDEALARLK